jgi:hypothetical protein
MLRCRADLSHRGMDIAQRIALWAGVLGQIRLECLNSARFYISGTLHL